MPAKFVPNPGFASEVAAQFGDLIEEATFVMERETKVRTPVRTGNLRNGWHTDVTRNGGNVHGEVSNPVEYAVYVEKGTFKMAGRHMLAGGVTAAAQWLADHGFKVTYTADGG